MNDPYQRFVVAFDACPDMVFKRAISSPPWFASKEYLEQWCNDTATALDLHTMLERFKTMSIKFSSIGHFFAAAVSDAQKVEQFLKTKVEAVITKIGEVAENSQEQKTIAALTSLIPVVGPEAATFERSIFAAAGPVLALANDAVHGAEAVAEAAEAKLMDLMKDQTAVDDLKAFIKGLAPTAAAIGYDFAGAVTTANGSAVVTS